MKTRALYTEYNVPMRSVGGKMILFFFFYNIQEINGNEYGRKEPDWGMRDTGRKEIFFHRTLILFLTT